MTDHFDKVVVSGRKLYGWKNPALQKNPGGRSSEGYSEIKTKCLETGTLFEDPNFPANDSSICFSEDQRKEYKWMRPHEITVQPQFFVGGASRFDVKQGELGDCWLLAAVANLTLNEKLFHQIVLQDNSFDNDYCGAFHFRFWQYGSWIEVVIDDRLPTRYNQLVFMHSSDTNEFWSALLEKAYAKLHGSYEALKGGRTSEALVDFTGGLAEQYEVKEAPAENIFRIVETAFKRSSFLACSLQADPNKEEAETEDGLVQGHAYSITAVRTIENYSSGVVSLLRIRNPWGDETEWKGAWSDGSKEWNAISEDKRQDFGLNFESDGEFWMSLEDFTRCWDRLEVCNLSAHCLEREEEARKSWKRNDFEGSWVRGATAGGCRNYLPTFASNPQFTIQLESSDESEHCTVLVALMQKNRRAARQLGKDCLTIGFIIYEITNETKGLTKNKPLPMSYFRVTPSVAKSPSFVNLREVTGRFNLSPGKYVIVPSTYEPNEEAEFILRVFTESEAEMEENDEELGMADVVDKIHETLEGSQEVVELFKSVAGEDQEVDWSELKGVLDKGMEEEANFNGFSRDLCRSLVALMDKDMSGKLGLEEFITLWNSVCRWKAVFKVYDKDNSGYLDSFELREALGSAGYRITNKILQTLVLRYGDSSGRIFFDDFIMCAIKLWAMIQTFQERFGASHGTNLEKGKIITITQDDWIMTTLYS